MAWLFIGLMPGLAFSAGDENGSPSAPLLSSPPTVSGVASQPTAVKPAAPSLFSPSQVFNVLRHPAELVKTASEELPVPPAAPGANGSPAQQQFIPLAQPKDPSNVVVNGDGGRISLMVRDASLRHVISLIAETQNLNIVFAATTDVQITASFDRVPWQQVLDALLSSSGYVWTNQNGIIFISNLETASLMAPGTEGRRVKVFELDYASSVDIDQAVKGLLSPAGQSWIMESSSTDNRRTKEAVVVVDYAGHLQRIADYIFQADQPPRQVLIEVHILKVALKDDSRNGVNFEALANFSNNELSFRSVGFANQTDSPAFFLQVDGTALSGLVELLQTTTDAKNLASPKILALSGQESRIQIGEQLGFRVTTTTQTSSLESVQFLDVGVVLRVTPRITRDNRVMMRIKPEVSTGQVNPDTGLPSEETTELETDVLLNDGQGMVIGGLIQETDSNTQSKIPWLGDLPYVGALFQKRQVIKDRSEIIITLSPHVQPYTPMVAQRENFQLMRAHDPLTVGPLRRFPRPYEARLPDTFTNPKLRFLPPVEEGAACLSDGVVPDPIPAAEQAQPDARIPR